MKTLTKGTMTCHECRGHLEILYFDIDWMKCDYCFYCQCLECGEQNNIIVAMEDFIELSQKMLGENIRLPTGENDENSN